MSFLTNSSLRVSHETIYRSLFIQARGVLKKELMQHLRSGRRLRRAIRTDTQGEQRGKIDAVSIRQRPADIEDRAIPGHWEGDLLSGSNNSHIVTLVERRRKTETGARTARLAAPESVSLRTSIHQCQARSR
jgi:IS30 family transposase